MFTFYKIMTPGQEVNRIVLSKVLPCTPKAGEEATGVKMHKILAWAGMICAVMAFYTGYKHK